ncbi:hypothetical protein AAFC00_005457 [Neodothiora populina]
MQLFAAQTQDDHTDGNVHSKPSSRLYRKLYISHALSTWNSRVFEFGAVLFLSTIFPGTLLPASVYALSRSASVVLFSGLVGSFIDHGERMYVVRVSIIGQRIATALSCTLLWFMSLPDHLSTSLTVISLTILSVLACIEKLSSLMNTISIERDWVVIIAQRNEEVLQQLNAQMRRIDLFCKLVGPLAIAIVDGFSTRIAITVTFTMTCLSIGVEYFAIANVYDGVPALSERNPSTVTASRQATSFVNILVKQCHSTISGLHLYIHHAAFLPSLSLSLLYLTVLSFGGQFVTYLLALGFTSATIGLLRTLSTVLELSATWLGPMVMQRIGPVRSGIWFLNWQLIMVCLSVLSLWLTKLNQTWTIVLLLTGIILSRTGLWGFDLSTQLIIQDSVQADQRGAFSAIEASVQSVFELLSFASTVVFAKPGQFKYPAAISGTAVATAGILYACFVRCRRGHLFHASDCVKGRGSSGKRDGWLMMRRPQQWQQVPQSEVRDGDFDNNSNGNQRADVDEEV